MQNFKQGKHNSTITFFPSETEGDCIDYNIAVLVHKLPTLEIHYTVTIHTSPPDEGREDGCSDWRLLYCRLRLKLCLILLMIASLLPELILAVECAPGEEGGM